MRYPGCESRTSAAARSSGPRFSPLGAFTQIPATAVRDQLRLALTQWGLPARFRVDNGAPWGSWGDFPTALALWVIGLGVGMHWNRPRTPEQNGKLERWHGSLKTECVRPWEPCSLEEAIRRISRYVEYYNYVRLHSSLGYVTPADKMNGLEPVIFAERDRKLEEARQRRRLVRQSQEVAL
jgi:transposase InsO family protein